MERISIKPEREYLREIVSKIQSNIYAIPAFQRDFVWKKNQILDLFDSISKGYPIGSIILWKPKGEDKPPVKNIITEKVSDELSVEYFVLDGRQRCTAFLGCVMGWDDKPERFDLYFDVDNCTFQYPKRKSKLSGLYKVSDIFDTFKMLGVLQRIMQSDIPNAQKQVQVNNIKEINSILQTYEIGEMILENCTLEESSIAFSRINSKGTDISKVAMLQALTYKKRSGLLLADEITKIIESLSRYGFSMLKQDDVLSCCYRYINKNHYDSNLLDAMSNADVASIIPRLRSDLTRAVKFLNETCGVISVKLLPYNRQLFAIASFFKDNANPTQQQLDELKRWFFYTTYQQSFLNGSLSNIRSLFNRFDEFVKGHKDTAIDYEPVEIDYLLDFKFSASSALSDFIILLQVLQRRRTYPEESLEYVGEFRFQGNKPAGSFVLLSSTDREAVSALIAGNSHKYEDKFFLTEEILSLMNNTQSMSNALFKRRQLICSMTRDFLISLGLEISPKDNSNKDASESILSEFDELNNEERRELCAILSDCGRRGSVIYRIEHPTNDTFTIDYGSFEHPYSLNSDSAKKCLNIIEDKFCNGEDAESYFSWRIALGDEG